MRFKSLKSRYRDKVRDLIKPNSRLDGRVLVHVSTRRRGIVSDYINMSLESLPAYKWAVRLNSAVKH